MQETAVPSDRPVEVAVEVNFESVHQQFYLKPSHVYRFADSAGTAWWKSVIALTHSEFFAEARLGAVLTYLRVDIMPVALMPQDTVTVRFTTRLGRYSFLPGKPARYGGIDELAILDAHGATAATLQAYWLWFHHAAEGKPATIAEPPPRFPPVIRDLAPHEPPPAVEGAVANRFRWARRETDLNQHVNSIAFIERGENALADAGEPVSGAPRVEVWYLKPGFEGAQGEARLERRADGAYVALRGEAHNLAILRFSERRA